jgi:hypothetical protein
VILLLDAPFVRSRRLNLTQTRRRPISPICGTAQPKPASDSPVTGLVSAASSSAKFASRLRKFGVMSTFEQLVGTDQSPASANDCWPVEIETRALMSKGACASIVIAFPSFLPAKS